MSTHDNQLKPISYSVEEISRVNNIGRTSIYKALGEGKLRGMKLGRKTLILESDFRGARSRPKRMIRTARQSSRCP